MIRIEEALKIILKGIVPLPAEEVRLTESLDRVLAEHIYSDIDIPLLDNSAMDGYAVRASDTTGAARNNPRILEVIEDLQAGYLASRKVEGNQAIRIMTGAPIPQGADSVVIVEETEKEAENNVKVFKETKGGKNRRRASEDIKKGELVISKGTSVNSAHVGILASLGKAAVKVTRKPKVAVLATGDEIIDIDEKLEP